MVIATDLTVEGPSSIEGKTGEQIQLSATISPADVTLDRILWHSTNPAIATVDNYGLVTIHNIDPSESEIQTFSETDTYMCEIIASTLYDNSPVATVKIEVSESDSIEYINADNGSDFGSAHRPNHIYTIHGIMIKRNASQEDVDALSPGIYIIGSKKVLIK